MKIRVAVGYSCCRVLAQSVESSKKRRIKKAFLKHRGCEAVRHCAWHKLYTFGFPNWNCKTVMTKLLVTCSAAAACSLASAAWRWCISFRNKTSARRSSNPEQLRPANISRHWLVLRPYGPMALQFKVLRQTAVGPFFFERSSGHFWPVPTVSAFGPSATGTWEAMSQSSGGRGSNDFQNTRNAHDNLHKLR